MSEQTQPPQPEFKGFGKPTEAKPASPKKRRRPMPRLPEEDFQARKRFEQAEKTGQPTWEIFVREAGQSEWKAGGAIAVASNLVERAIYDSEQKLLQSVRRQHQSLRKATGPFEFGYRRREFPDDPIQLARRPQPTLIDRVRGFLSRFGAKKQTGR